MPQGRSESENITHSFFVGSCDDDAFTCLSAIGSSFCDFLGSFVCFGADLKEEAEEEGADEDDETDDREEEE